MHSTHDQLFDDCINNSFKHWHLPSSKDVETWGGHTPYVSWPRAIKVCHPILYAIGNF